MQRTDANYPHARESTDPYTSVENHASITNTLQDRLKFESPLCNALVNMAKQPATPTCQSDACIFVKGSAGKCAPGNLLLKMAITKLGACLNIEGLVPASMISLFARRSAVKLS